MTTTTLSMSDVNAALRVMYDDSGDDQTLKVHKLLAWVDREEDFVDYYKRLPVKTGNPRGTASSLSTAQSNTVQNNPGAFNLTKVELFNTPKVSMELVEGAMSGAAERFLKDIVNIVDGAKESVEGAMGRQIYRASYGVFSRVYSGTSSPITVGSTTMALPQDLYDIEVGDIITASPNADMSSARSGTGTVTAVDKDAGTITYSGTITSLAAGDYLAISGQTAVASGVLAWNPTSAPSATAFFGQDRTVSQYLAGRRLDLSTSAPEEVFAKINATLHGMAVKPKIYCMNPMDLANFEVSVSGQKVITSNKYDFGLDAVTAYGMDILPDDDCPRGYLFGIPDGFKVHSLGKAPKTVDADGNTLLRISNADSVEARVVSRWQAGCSTPYALLTVTLPT